MLTLVACAISIDDVRDIFRASPSLAERLKATAAARFAQPSPTKRRWFGPVLHRDPDERVDAAHPSQHDLDTLLAGSFIQADRQVPSWQLLIVFLEELAAASARVEWDPSLSDQIEFDLARAGLNSDYALRNLAERDLGIPLRPLPGQLAGYAKHVQVAETLAALGRVYARPEVGAAVRAVVDPLIPVLETSAANPHLDLVVATTPTP